MKTVCLVAILGLICLAPDRLRADDLDDLKAASDSTRSTLRAAIDAEDTDRILSVFTSDAAVITTRGRVVQGHFTMKAALTAIFLMAGDYEVDAERFSLNLIDSLGYETGMYTLSQAKEDGPARQLSERFTLIWKKEGEAWKIHRAIGLR